MKAIISKSKLTDEGNVKYYISRKINNPFDI